MATIERWLIASGGLSAISNQSDNLPKVLVGKMAIDSQQYVV